MDLSKNLGHGRDVPILLDQNFAAAGAGAGSDFEQALGFVPVMPSPGSGFVGLTYKNQVKVRRVAICPAATITGVATNNFTLNVNWYRAGVKLGTIATVTFASGTNAPLLQPYYLPTPLLNNLPVVLLPGDVLTIQRVSNGTGLASPQFAAQADMVGADTGE